MTKPHRLQAVLFDWAGTTIDHGSRAPAAVFLEIFRREGVTITEAEAREPMGRAKCDHIATVAQMPRVSAAWAAVHGATPTMADVDRMYAEFLPLQQATLGQHVDIIPGVIETVAACRARGMKIGSSTGYTRALMDVVLPLAKAGGYAPDVTIVADDVPMGRPEPWMTFRAAEQLRVYPMSTIVVVDDTPVGIEAGLAAGTWTVAVTRTGNALGLSAAEVAALPAAALAERLANIRASFTALGAHYVLESAADLLPLLDEINGRLASSQRP